MRKTPRGIDKEAYDLAFFLSNIQMDPNGGCWFWEDTLTPAGYGVFWSAERKTQVLAHRFSHETFKGPVPKGFDTDHLCRIECCVNPDHLESVTHGENLWRSPNFPGRVTHCPKGHEYTSENTYVTPKGERVCRTCKRERGKRYNKFHKPWRRYDRHRSAATNTQEPI